MEIHYTSENNVQILIALMKHHRVKRIVASPGTTNITFVMSLQHDSFFQVFSAPDERSAAYIACGLAAETGEAVVLSCTGATASRNYLPGLTEAFYRKLPILAVTSSQHLGRVGQYVAQVIDRSSQPPDVCRLSVQVPSVHSAEDRWACEVKLNEALLELKRNGGGPVHVNLVTEYSKDFSIRDLPKVQVIDRIGHEDLFPSLQGKRVGVFVGAHAFWDERLTAAADAFCAAYDGVMLCDHTSNYRGPYRVLAPLIAKQTQYNATCKAMDVLVHIGEVSGASVRFGQKETWRVSPDGEIRDPFGRLRYVFEMGELAFFERYASEAEQSEAKTAFLESWVREDIMLREKILDLPFSNPWIAQQTAHRIPEHSALHLGIFNSLRSWNMFETPASVQCWCNTGGFGIDGGVSSLLGASLANPEKLYFGVVGDLAFFYDMNALGNRHVGPNIRLLVVNNGVGTEFKNYNHPAAMFGTDADSFIAARGHYGSQSRNLLRHYAEDLGFEYMAATCKDEYLTFVERFVVPEITGSPMLLEVFTNSEDESDAIKAMNTLERDAAGAAKNAVKGVIGDKGVRVIKHILRR